MVKHDGMWPSKPAVDVLPCYLRHTLHNLAHFDFGIISYHDQESQPNTGGYKYDPK